MDSNKGKENPILPAHATLDKLVLGKKKQHVAARLLRMWEAINFNNRSLMSLDFLLLDNKVICINTFIVLLIWFENHYIV